MATAVAASVQETVSWSANELHSLTWNAEFGIRCLASGVLAVIIYVTFAAVLHRMYPRSVSSRNIFAIEWDSDIALGLYSVLFGTPFLQLFGVIDEKYPAFSMLYTEINSLEGVAYWLLSIPAYLLLWDATFYVTHLILHSNFVFQLSHHKHHRFNPPTAWSGIAIDGIETFLSGLIPYFLPLFVMPFHLPTVYAINIALVAWATLLHSRCDWPGNWLFIGPKDHNLHHYRGKQNTNFAAIFKIWDRMFGTLDLDTVPTWVMEEQRELKKSI